MRTRSSKLEAQSPRNTRVQVLRLQTVGSSRHAHRRPTEGAPVRGLLGTPLTSVPSQQLLDGLGQECPKLLTGSKPLNQMAQPATLTSWVRSPWACSGASGRSGAGGSTRAAAGQPGVGGGEAGPDTQPWLVTSRRRDPAGPHSSAHAHGTCLIAERPQHKRSRHRKGPEPEGLSLQLTPRTRGLRPLPTPRPAGTPLLPGGSSSVAASTEPTGMRPHRQPRPTREPVGPAEPEAERVQRQGVYEVCKQMDQTLHGDHQEPELQHRQCSGPLGWDRGQSQAGRP